MIIGNERTLKYTLQKTIDVYEKLCNSALFISVATAYTHRNLFMTRGTLGVY